MGDDQMWCQSEDSGGHTVWSLVDEKQNLLLQKGKLGLKSACGRPCDYLGFVDSDPDRPGRRSNFCKFKRPRATSADLGGVPHYCEMRGFTVDPVQLLEDADSGSTTPRAADDQKAFE